MRRIVAFNRVTADGYFAGTDEKLDWMVPDEELDRRSADSIDEGGVGTVLFGRRTYQQFASFWPHAFDDSKTSPDPHAAGRRSEELRAMANWLNEATKIVFSRTLKDVTWKNTRLIHEFNPDDVLAMKRQPGQDMIIFGSGTLASQLTEHGLIDEYHFIVTPILLGSGRPLVKDVSKHLKLNLVEAKPYKSGNVMLRYERLGHAA